MSGNPRRYQSHDVMRMNPGQSAKKRATCTGPEEEIETEAQRHLQTLLKKQLDTKTTLEKELSKKKEFTGGQGFKPLASDISGVSTLSSYSNIAHTDSHLEELKQCGLTDEEISFKLYYDEENNDKSKAKKARLQMDPTAKEKKIAEINHKIEKRNSALSKDDAFSSTVELSRHELDLEKALTQNSSDKSQFLKKLLKKKSRHKMIHPDHPINHIDSILDTISDGSKKQLLASKDDDTQGHDNDEDPENDSSVSQGCPTLEDFKNSCENYEEFVKQKLKDSIVFIPEETIEKSRLSEEEIKKLPRFANYKPGSPSRVLYLKNLCRSLKKEDLMSLFLRFEKKEKPELIFKLLTGKMKGQAFITFPDCETAEKAMNLVNGYTFKGKPIIIEYGKKPDG